MKQSHLHLRNTLEQMQQLALSRNGECLSKEYVNNQTKLLWKCSNDHTFAASPNTVQQGHWCAKCAGNKRRTIDDLHEVAESRGGKCHSNEYSPHSLIEWECANGHRWSAKAGFVIGGTWCPDCAGSIGESLCRQIFEFIFQVEFPKTRPAWARSTGHNLEFDGYNPVIQLAFEYQGAHHNVRYAHFHKKEEHFHEQQKRDRLKHQVAADHEVVLVVIEQFNSRSPVRELAESVKCQLKEKNISFPDFDLQALESFLSVQVSVLNQLRAIASTKGGKLMSTGFLGWSRKLKWRCSEGHVWEAMPRLIKKGRWCPECGLKRNTLEGMHNLAARRNGKCLSVSYKNDQTKLEWECEKGHHFLSAPRKVIIGQWCPTCAGRNKSLSIMQEVAKSRGGVCLSTSYARMDKHLEWQCSKGHTWKAIPSNVLDNGSWCPYCVGKAPKTLVDMQKLAATKGGVCLSGTFVNVHAHLEWECSKGHQWKATPSNVQKGTWCPECARKRMGHRKNKPLDFRPTLSP